MSTRDFINQVKRKMPDDAPVPSEDRVRFQFAPSKPWSLVAEGYSGRLSIKNMTDKRQLNHDHQHHAACVFRYLWSCNQTSSGLFPHIGWWQASYKGGRTWVSCSGSWESSRKMYHSVLVIMILRSLKSSQVFLSFAIFLKQLRKVLWWPDHGHLNRSIWTEQPTSSRCWVKVYNFRLLSVNTCSHPTGFAAVCWRGTRPQHHLWQRASSPYCSFPFSPTRLLTGSKNLPWSQFPEPSGNMKGYPQPSCWVDECLLQLLWKTLCEHHIWD